MCVWVTSQTHRLTVDSDNSCHVNLYVDNFVWSDSGIVGGSTGCCHPSDPWVSRLCARKKKIQCDLCVFRKWLWRWNHLAEDISLAGFWLWKAGKCQLTWFKKTKNKNRLEDISPANVPVFHHWVTQVDLIPSELEETWTSGWVMEALAW